MCAKLVSSSVCRFRRPPCQCLIEKCLYFFMCTCNIAELLATHEETLLNKEGSGCRVLLQNEKEEDLARMFQLFRRLEDGLPPMAKIVKEHIQEMGLAVVSEREAKAREAKDSRCLSKNVMISVLWRGAYTPILGDPACTLFVVALIRRSYGSCSRCATNIECLCTNNSRATRSFKKPSKMHSKYLSTRSVRIVMATLLVRVTS